METIKLVTINVRGTLFQLDEEEWTSFLKTTTVPLKKVYQPSNLANCRRHMPVTESESIYYLNRNPWFFQFILDYFHTNELHFPHDTCPEAILTELKFYGLTEEALAPCCWQRVREFQERKLTDEYIALRWSQMEHRPSEIYEPKTKPTSGGGSDTSGGAVASSSGNSTEEKSCCCGRMTLSPKCQARMERVRLFLDDPSSSKYAKGWSIFISLVILFSTLIVILETEPNLRTPTFSEFRPTTNISMGDGLLMEFIVNSRGADWLEVIDVFLLTILTVEYVARLVVSQSKWRFVLHPLSIIDILGILPVWIFFAMELVEIDFENKEEGSEPWNDGVKHAVLALGILRLLRIFRIVRIFMNHRNLKIVLLSIGRSYHQMFVLLALLVVLACVFGSAAFYIELHVDNFETIFEGMWWAIVTMTTVGYGDFAPITGEGYAVGVMCALSGIVVIALATTVIVSNFVHTYEAVERLLAQEAQNDASVSKNRERKIRAPKYQNNL